ncbi:hypothetical protein I8J29_05470 [Paenibacillus sp. MWE-103]|uniref:DUF5722 domain-containing protein n=1 Tax=Paenibacillus artemisiicola TaxID=1172618 RepID=A0ABS3W663_9BACL|nr:DUF5722 domain-containing protein [Paenibacillus artemisiicola]MBO7743635.1 hypothetical protein [Paenibacillus artemisiicola]
MKTRRRSVVFAIVTAFILQLLAPAGAFAGAYDPALVPKDAYAGNAIYPDRVINDFNSPDQAAGWAAGTNVDSVGVVSSLLNSPGSPFEGAGALEVMPKQVKAYEWRTISRAFPEPLDLSGDNFIALAANIWGWKQDDFFLKMTLTSGSDTFEAVSGLGANKWNVMYFDIHNWTHRNAIDRIEFSYMKNYDLDGMSPGDPGYAYWDGRLQLDRLSAAKIAGLDFNVPGVAEGFAAAGGTADVSVSPTNGSLQYIITDPANAYLESPGLGLDASKRNVVNLRMKNDTGAAKLKISWITDRDPGWDEAKSMSFDLSDSAAFADYEFVMSGAAWKDTIDRIRISPVAAAAGTMLDLDRIDFSLRNVDAYAYQGSIDHAAIDEGGTAITIGGSVNADYLNANPGAEAQAFELPVYADEKTADYAAMTPLAASAASGTVGLSFAVLDNTRTRAYSKFAVVLKNGSGAYALLDKAKYVTNPEILAPNKDPYTPTKSIKGLQVQLPADAERLGVQHGAINIAYDQLLTVSDHGANSIPYAFNGSTYYFRKSSVSDLDNQISSMTNNGMAVTAILILYRTGMTDPDSPNKDLVHPDSTPDGTVFAPNLTDETGVNYYEAITSFIAERYSRADKKYGRVMGFIVGNEVGQNKVWNNMGPKLLDDYVDQYERTLRATYNIVKSKMENARVYISLDHFWNAGNSPESQWVYDNKAVVDKLNKRAQEGGNYDWNIAFHPYPEDLFNPRTWNDVTATDSFDTYRITFKNLQVLTDYLQQAALTYNGAQRHVILSEQGFHSGGNTQAEQEVQAAAYAYAYYKVKSLPGIDAFILHRHVDHAAEGGLNLGLWTNMPGQTNEAYAQKVIYDVFKKIDTADSLGVTAFAKGIIGVNDWTEAIPEFDPAKLEERPAQASAPMGTPSDASGEVTLSSFDADLNGWFATDNVSGAALDTADQAAGAGSLKASVTGSRLQDYKGVTRVFDSPQDLSATPVVQAAVKAVGIGAGEKARFMIRVYSGDRVIEGSVAAAAEAWNEVAIDLTGWAGLGSVDRLKMWAQPEKPVVWSSGALKVDEVSAAASAVVKQLEVTLDAPGKPAAGDTLTVHIRNSGNGSFAGNVGLAGLNGITVDKSSVPVTIPAGGEAAVGTKIDSLVPVDYRSGALQVTVDGGTYVFTLTEAGYPDYTADAGELVFGDFESGRTDGWIAGGKTAAVASVKKDAQNNAPSAAHHGTYMLEAVKSADVATTESKVVKTFKNPVDLSGYVKVRADLFGWGGTSSAYVAKMKLTAADGTSVTAEQEVNPNTWVDLAADLTNFAGKTNVTAIEISYRGKDTAYYSGAWGGHFYVDHVRTEAPESVSIPIGGGSATATLDPAAGILNVDLPQGLLASAFADTEPDRRGVKSLTVNVPAVGGAETYVLAFTAGSLSANRASELLTVMTPIGTVTIPNNLFHQPGVAASQAVGIRVEAVDGTGIKLSLLMDGKPEDWNVPGAKIAVTIPYAATAAEQGSPERIVVKRIDKAGKALPVPSGRYDVMTGTISFDADRFGQYRVTFLP